MASVWKWICGAFTTLGTWLAYLLGGWDAALTIMFIAMGLDYVTGIAVALMGRSSKTEDGRFQSRAAFTGLTKKLLMLVIVAVATLVDRMIGTNGVCRLAAIGFYVANEGMSIIENASAMGVPFPRGLLEVLEKLRQKNEGVEVPVTGSPEEKEQGQKQGNAAEK